ncbi:MAG: hypothetical protein M1835_007353 [Candelina submexicana]|nr:MAG: hypothetical protein M1835_007353 [Candelina submexicana]
MDVKSGNPISRPAYVEGESTTILPGSVAQGSVPFLTLNGSSYPESIFDIDFSTSRGTSHTGSRLFPFDMTGLEAGHEYAFKLVDPGVTWWRYGTLEQVSTKEAIPKPFGPSEGTQLGFRARSFHGFQAVAALPQPPDISVSLSTSSDICHLSGTPAFAVNISFTLHAAKPITVISAFSSPFDQLYVEIIDAETKENAALGDFICACFDSEGPYAADHFLVLKPETPYLQRVTLTPVENPNNPETSARYTSTMGRLVSGRSYLARLDGSMFDSEIKWWSYDTIDEVLLYAGTIGESGLPYVPPIPLDLSQEVGFTAVDP